MLMHSTETQRAVTYYEVPSNEKLERMKEILPVGVGMKDVQLIMLNNDNQQVCFHPTFTWYLCI